MATRTVSVILRAEVGQYIAGMTRASGATRELGTLGQRSGQQARLGFGQAASGATLLGAAVVAGIGLAVSKSMEFEKSMSAVQAATQASAGTMGQLRDAAMRAGADTQYSATQAADGITEMAKAGVSAKDIMGGGLSGALALAAAGQIDVADAAGIASIAMTQFSLTGADLPHVADLLAAGAGKAMGSVDDLGMALKQSGLVASAAGLSIEETTGTLSAFASAGLLGSDAGTSLKTMLQMLQAPTEKSSSLMAQLGIDMYDANGDMLGVSEMAGELQSSLGGLTEEQRNAALATIFGADAVRAANVLYKEGASGITNWTNKVNDAGYAQEQAAALTDNLKGDLERLGGAWDTFLINAGTGAQGPLRELTQGLTGLVDGASWVVDAFDKIPGPVLAGVAAFTALKLLHGPLDAMFGRVAVWMTSTVTGMGMATGATSGFTLATGAARAAVVGLATAAAPLAGILAAAFIIKGVYDLANAGDDARESVEMLNAQIAAAEGNSAKFDATTSGITTLTGKVTELKEKLADDGAWETTILGAMLTGAADDAAALEEYEAQLAELTAATDRQASSVQTLGDKYGMNKEQVQAFADAHGIDLSGAVDKVQWDFQRLQSAENGSAESALILGANLLDLAPAAETAATATQLLGDTSTWTQDQVKIATDTITKWREELQTVGESFVEPLGLYKTLLDEKSAKEQEAAEKTAAATEDSSDSWQDYVTDSKVSLTEWAGALEQQIKDQDAWRENIVRITARGGLEVGQQFAAMGVEGAAQTAAMANATDTEFNRMATAMKEDAKRGSSDAAAELDTGMRAMALIGAAGGKQTAEQIAAQLNIGVEQVKKIAGDYGFGLAESVNPVLLALGKPKITYTGSAILANGRIAGKAAGGIIEGPYEGPTADNVLIRANPREFMQPVAAVDHYGVGFMEAVRTRQFPKDAIPGFAEGGLIGLGRRLQSMGALVTEHPAFGGVAMGGHGKTSLHYTGRAIDVNTRPGTSALEQRELAPMMALARQLGFRTIFMAKDHFNHGHVDDGGGASMGTGGLTPGVTLPKPLSSSPFAAPLSTSVDAAMQRMYDEASAFVEANTFMPTEGEGSPFSNGSGVTRNLGRQIAAAMGYANQFSSIDSIFSRESGWNPNAQNPTSTAYGIPQFLNATWAQYGGKTSDPGEQIRDGIRYMVDRYGSPAGAEAFWNKNRWYDDGGLLLPGVTIAHNDTGKPETIRTYEQEAGIQSRLRSREVSAGSGVGVVTQHIHHHHAYEVDVRSSGDYDMAARATLRQMNKQERRALAGV